MTKELEGDLHNIFSAIFSGRKVNENFMEDLNKVFFVLTEYTFLEYRELKICNCTNKQIELNNEQHT